MGGIINRVSEESGRAIAEAAQTNKMTLYRYFDSKEARADVSG